MKIMQNFREQKSKQKKSDKFQQYRSSVVNTTLSKLSHNLYGEEREKKRLPQKKKIKINLKQE